MRKWLGRLAFSFIVLAAVCVWEGRRAQEQNKPAAGYYIGAALLAGAGMAGMRERHRPPQ
jgi:hypothetical protein